MSINIFLLVLALVSLCLAAASAPALGRLNWGWLGMALWMLVQVFGGIKW